jgi:hypothetical protein
VLARLCRIPALWRMPLGLIGCTVVVETAFRVGLQEMSSSELSTGKFN